GRPGFIPVPLAKDIRTSPHRAEYLPLVPELFPIAYKYRHNPASSRSEARSAPGGCLKLRCILFSASLLACVSLSLAQTITLRPKVPAGPLGTPVQFTGTVSGLSNTAVKWSAGGACGRQCQRRLHLQLRSLYSASPHAGTESRADRGHKR